VTITTVGYGDYTPVTTEGRFIAAGVMVGGIALIGVVTATIASWIIDQVGRRDEESEAVTRREIRELTDEVRALRAEVAATATTTATTTATVVPSVSCPDDAGRPPTA
jgi:voltage-gated potassium channel